MGVHSYINNEDNMNNEDNLKNKNNLDKDSNFGKDTKLDKNKQTDNANIELFENMPVPKAVSTMAIPTIMGQLIVLIYNIADTFFLGKTNNPDMVAAASLILPVFNISLSLAGLAGVGGGALISRLLGSKNYEEAKKVSSFSIYFCVILAGIFSMLTLMFMRPLLSVLGANEATYGFARGYAICVIVLGGIPTVLSNTLSSLLRSVGESKRAGFGVMMGGIINIVLDPIFMFVLLPAGREIIGAGIATFLSNIISCIYFVVIMIKLGKTSVLRLYSIKKVPLMSSIKSIFGVGIPSCVATLLFDCDYIVLDKLMSGYGNFALAAVGIVLKAERLPLNVGIGLCQGMMPIIAYNYSAKNIKRYKDVKNFSRLAGIVFSLLSVSMYLIFAHNIINIFIDNAETIRLGTTFLRVRSLATPLMFLSFFHVYLFNGVGEGKRALFLGVMRWAVFNIPMLFILNYFIGMYGLVWSQITADIFTVALSLYVYERFNREKLE